MMDEAFAYVENEPIAVIRGGVMGDRLLGVEPSGALGRAIQLTKGEIEPILSTRGRSIMYIAGPSGSGKSTVAATLIRNHLRAYPKSEIIAFVRGSLDDDPAWGQVKRAMSQIELTADFLSETPDVTLLPENSVILFDDVLSLPDDKLRKMVQKLAIDVMEVGRKRKIHVILTSHLISPSDLRFGRVVLNEMTALVLFPGQGGAHQIQYCLSKYIGMSKAEVARVLKTPSRWALIHTRAPRFVLNEGAAWLI